MKVHDLIAHLTAFAASSPQNPHADVVLLTSHDSYAPLERGDNAKGFHGEHFLVLVPSNQTLPIREMRVQ